MDGLNLYAYCRNNPVYYVDPSGNICDSAAQEIMKKFKMNGTFTASRNEQKKLAAYLRNKDRNGIPLTPMESLCQMPKWELRSLNPIKHQNKVRFAIQMERKAVIRKGINMGRQYHFAMEGADEKLFMEYLKDNGYIVYLERTHRMPEIIEEFPASFSDAWFICIYHPAFGDMKFKSYMLDGKSNTKIDYIESMTEPVIEFTRTLVCHEEKKIRSGRIWMQMKYWNEYDELVSKSENLDKGFKDIKNG